MPFLLLLLLTLVCLPDDPWPAPWWARSLPDPLALSWCATLTWLVVLLLAGLAHGVAGRAATHLAVYPGHRERVLRGYGRFRTYYVFLLIGAYALSLYFLGWGWTVQRFCGHGAAEVPGAELLVLAPFLVGLVLSWAAFYDAERALHNAGDADSSEPFWSRAAYVAFHIRQNVAFICVPLLLLVLMKGVRRLLPQGEEGVAGWLTPVVGGALAASVFVGMPWILRLVLGLRPLPAGPLRDRLEATARRLRFRCSNILVWDTRGGMVNAMVAGIVPGVRYVLLTDRLMSELTPDEVEAVFGHEIGHVKHHHMLYYLAFLLGSLLLLGVLFGVLAPYLPFGEHPEHAESSPLQALPLVMMLGAYIFVVFGFLSRRCERQADVYGCRAVSCGRTDCRGHEGATELAAGGRGLCPTGIRTFIEALEKVARLNGISRDKPGWLSSWQHSTIARRVGFLQDVLDNPQLERRFQRRVALVKWGLFLGLLAALAVLLYVALQGPDQPDGDAPVTPRTAERTAPLE
jgi:Zn-dependent protease with chaperone function